MARVTAANGEDMGLIDGNLRAMAHALVAPAVAASLVRICLASRVFLGCRRTALN